MPYNSRKTHQKAVFLSLKCLGKRVAGMKTVVVGTRTVIIAATTVLIRDSDGPNR